MPLSEDLKGRTGETKDNAVITEDVRISGYRQYYGGYQCFLHRLEIHPNQCK
jgi:hypothetical protein